MTTFLSLMIILFNICFIFFTYKKIAKSDFFSWIMLISINEFFVLVLRPFSLIFLENYQSPYFFNNENVDLYVLLTLLLDSIAYIFIVIGYLIFFNKKRNKKNISQNFIIKRKFLIIFLLFTTLSLFLWIYTIQKAGGLLYVLQNMSLRTQIYKINESYILMEMSKNSIEISILGLSLYFIYKKRIYNLIYITLLGAFLLISFGGRGNVVLLLYSELIFIHYVYSKIKPKVVLFLGLIFVIIIYFMSMLRNDYFLQQEYNSNAFINYIITISYFNRSFDFATVYIEKYFNEGKNFWGENILGFTAILPRNIYQNKQDIIGAKFAKLLYNETDYAISSTFASSILAYYGIFFLPIIALIIGFIGAAFWYHYVANHYKNPFRLIVYAVFGVYIPSLFIDLAQAFPKIVLSGILIYFLWIIYLIRR